MVKAPTQGRLPYAASPSLTWLCEANQRPEIQAYNLCFIATCFHRDELSKHSGIAEQARYEEIITSIDRTYPGLRNASLKEQKYVGKK
jgi:hypothetical protein